MIAFIPARSGSQRVKDKNIRILQCHPLIAYTIAAAIDSGLFTHIYCSSDSQQILDIATHYGAEPILRPADYATSTSPDSDWIRHAISHLYVHKGIDVDKYCILRPTSPFRTASTITRAFQCFDLGNWKWLKAVEPVTQHPNKTWIIHHHTSMSPTVSGDHLLPIQSLPQLYTQNGCIEFRTAEVRPTIHYTPFFTEGFEGVNIDTELDLLVAETIVMRGIASLPEVKALPFKIEEGKNV